MRGARTDTAQLPLRYGAAPRWLFERMTRLALQVSFGLQKQAIHFGIDTDNL